MNIKIGILNVPKHCNKHDLIHFVTVPISHSKLDLKACVQNKMAVIGVCSAVFFVHEYIVFGELRGFY